MSVEILENGLTVLAVRRSGTRMFAMSVLAGRRMHVDSEIGPGASDFLMRMIIRGAAGMDETEISRRLALIGGKLQVTDNPYLPFDDKYTRRGFAVMRFDCPGRFMEDAVSLLSSLVIKPDLTNSKNMEDAGREIDHAAGIRKRSPRDTARDSFHATLFDGAPYSGSIFGDGKSLNRVSPGDLERAHKLLFSPSNVIISILGNHPVEDLVNLVRKYFGKIGLEGKDIPKAVELLPDLPSEPRSVCTEMEGINQAYIYMGKVFRTIPTRDLDLGRLAISILSDRLAADLRETRGLAYSVGAYCVFEPELTYCMVSLGTAPENYESALEGIVEVIEKLRNGNVSMDELETAVNSFKGSGQMSVMSSLNKTYYNALDYRLDGKGDRTGFYRNLDGFSPEDVSEWARRFLDPATMTTASARPVCKTGETH